MNNNELNTFIDKVVAEFSKPYKPSKRKLRRERLGEIYPRLAELAVKAMNRIINKEEAKEYNQLYQEYKQLVEESLNDELPKR